MIESVWINLKPLNFLKNKLQSFFLGKLYKHTVNFLKLPTKKGAALEQRLFEVIHYIALSALRSPLITPSPHPSA
jgi:hypothetical protein